MASALDSVLLTIQQNDYATVAMVTLVVFDYVLTFGREIEYIWSKRWSGVSILFILARYCGLYCFIISALTGSSFLPGSEWVSYIINLLNSWMYILFLSAADLVMILRVWAMYNQSRSILCTLLTLYVLEIIPIIITTSIYSNPNKSTMTIVQVLDISLCIRGPASPTWTDVDSILQLVLGAVMYILVMFQFIRQSFQMYKATKRWQLNRYVTMIFSEGLLYFIFVLIFNIISVLAALGKTPSSGWQPLVWSMLEGYPEFMLIPRFIINMRQVYHGREGGHGGDIDSGFGLASLSTRGTVGTMVFADNGQNEELQQAEEIQMTEQGN